MEVKVKVRDDVRVSVSVGVGRCDIERGERERDIWHVSSYRMDIY